MTDAFTYRPQEISYLGFLETQLRDMQGIATLAYELVQNADDVKGPDGEVGSSWISFDVRDEALIVENDGVFRPVDFERLQMIAGGGKRAEAGTTGAFGLGFLAVYQVTDAPEIFSGGRHWTIRPEAEAGERIQERAVETTGTRLRLPWAFDPETPVRRALRLPAVRREGLDEIAHQLGQTLELAALFLGQLTRLTVKRSGKVVRRIVREEAKINGKAGRRLHLREEKGSSAAWLLLEGSFTAAASELCASHPQIERERPAQVELALPLGETPRQGRLFAGLPTETTSPLPFHLHAAFYPTSDRKRIHFGDGYQAAWNEAALRAAARLLADHLGTVRQALAPSPFWQLLQQVAYTQSLAVQGELPGIFTTFWQPVAAQVAELPTLYTIQEEWIRPGSGRVVDETLPEAELTLLRELGIPLAHQALAAYFPLLRRPEIGVPPLTLADLIGALADAGLSRKTPLYAAPPFLNNLGAWQVLWQLLARLTDPHALPAARAAEKRQLNQVAIVLDQMMTLQRPDRVFRGDAEAHVLFPNVAWVHPEIPEREFPGRLVTDFGARQAVERLAEKGIARLEELWRLGRLDLPRLFRWLEAQQIEIFADDPGLQREIRRLPLCPVGGELRPLADLYIPGGFEDPLGVAGTVPLDAVGGRRQFLEDLGVEPLGFDTYLHRELPRALAQQPDLPSDARHRLLRLLAERLGQFRDDDALQAQLSHLPLVPCLDGSFRPGEEVYATREAFTLLGEGTHIAEPAPTRAMEALYGWLGVRAQPAASDLIRRLSAIGEVVAATPQPPPAETVAVVRECWQRLQAFLAQDEVEQASLASLAEKPVIPLGSRRLARPDRLFLADDPALAAHFPGLEGQLITPDQEAAEAWTKAGLRLLSQAVSVEISTPAGMESAPEMQKRLAGRLSLIRRVLRMEGATEKADWLQTLQVASADSLQVQYRLATGDGTRLSAPVERKAALDRDRNLLYVAAGEQTPWLAVARELAQALSNSQAPGGLALALKEVLAADSSAAARGVLDELGYPDSPF